MKIFRYLLVAMAFVSLVACTKDDPIPTKGGDDDEPQPDPPTPEVVYKVGDHYKVGLTEGIVISVDAEGKHGMIVSLDEAQLKWSTVTECLGVKYAAFTFDDGMYNVSIVKNVPNWQKTYPAFYWCDAKNMAGLSGWMLPAPESITTLYTAFTGMAPVEEDSMNCGISQTDRSEKEAEFNKALTDAGGTPLTSAAHYWTSMELSAIVAYCVDFKTGAYSQMTNGEKSELNRVRAVKKF